MVSLGIVGLPNVGKSTLFNALTNLQVEVANYPFTTIEPHVGIVTVPDERLEKLAVLEKPAKVIPTIIEFKDIAGLVKDAHRGAGLGNQFLSHIREVDAIVEVVRFFADENIVHIEGKVDPKRDMETIETELILADLQLVEKKLENLKKSAKTGNKEEISKLGLANKFFEGLSAERLANSLEITDEQHKYLHEFPLLTLKPILYAANCKFNFVKKKFEGPAVIPAEAGIQNQWIPDLVRNDNTIFLDAQFESELSALEEEERKAYLKELKLAESGLHKLIKAAYKILNLITFFTRENKIVQAWTCKTGTKAPQAAGIIHADFEKGFIKAEVINWQILLDCGGYAKAREKGLIRLEGKEYEIADGDVVHFKFNV